MSYSLPSPQNPATLTYIIYGETDFTVIYNYTIGDRTFWPDNSSDPNDFFTLSNVLTLTGPPGARSDPYRKR